MNKNIAIIGGGMTGLVCGYKLSLLGYTITIYESSPQVGGLAAGFRLHGESLERAYHHLFMTDTDIIQLVADLGLGSQLLWHNSSIASYYKGSLYPFGGALDLLCFPPLSPANRIRLAGVIYYLQKSENWQKFSSITASAWLSKCCGRKVYECIWEPLLKGKFHTYDKSVSMAWLWARVNTRANSRASLFDSEKLGYFKGGFQIVMDALVEKIKNNGGEIHTDARISSILSSHEDKAVTISQDNTQTQFGSVIATVPSPVFSRLISKNSEATPEYISKLESISYLGAVCAVFSTKQSLSKYYWHNIQDSEAPYLAFIQHTNLVGAERYDNNHVYYLGAYVPHDHTYFTNSDNSIYDLFFSYLKKMFPDFNRALIEEKHLFRFKNAQHVVDTTYASRIPDYRTRLPNVYLSNFSQIFPEDRGTNFSVREANKIVRMILNDK
ncbi:MAG: NAD(P)/FAD-dependent oxidoreductase [bacterium]|nr:NAD(P)/FAD-dependent oxidoreductase [bacterium]